MMYSWKVDSFDSDVLGFKVAKIISLDPKNVRNLIRDLIKNKVSYATCRIQTNNLPLIHVLESTGFILVDGLISLIIDVSSIDPEVSPQIREAHKDDLPKLKKLTSGLYSLSRIDNDPLISKKHANDFFLRWIENSVKGEVADSVLVWDEKGEILGYVSLQKKGQIPLIGVAESARGKGIAKELLNASFAQFKKWSVKNVSIDTQINNIPALSVYQSAGFKIIDSHFTFRWVNE